MTLELEKRYTGQTAREYLSLRAQELHWREEQKIVEGYVSSLTLPVDTMVLDIPVGTGRFLELYTRHGFNILGIDISEDMLAEARRHAEDRGYKVTLEKGSINSIPLADRTADLTVCVRYLQHVDAPAYHVAVTELARVTNRALIIGIHSTERGWRGWVGVVQFLALHPSYLLRQLSARLRRRAQSRSSLPHSPSKKTAALASSLSEERLLREIESQEFIVRERAVVLTGLNIFRPIFYKLYLCQRRNYS